MCGERIEVRCLFVTLAYPPTQSSGAIQMKHLALEFVRQGHKVLVLHSNNAIAGNSEKRGNSNLLELDVRAGEPRDITYLKRMYFEMMAPFKIWKALDSDKYLLDEKYDLIVWYVPSIFLTPLIAKLKKRFACPVYLIQRDIFPDWLVDLNVIPLGLRYFILEGFARWQYFYSDVVGVQSPNNVSIIKKKIMKKKVKVEILYNWLTPIKVKKKPFKRVDEIVTKIANKKLVFLYAGNMGVAQEMPRLVKLAASFEEIHFLFIGRGSEQQEFEKSIQALGLKNVTLEAEITHEELCQVSAHCNVGLVSLDVRHKTYNIPGKLLFYLNSGLPVVVLCNEGNDIIDLVNNNGLGFATSSTSQDHVFLGVHSLIQKLETSEKLAKHCKKTAERLFSTHGKVKQIINAISSV